MCGCMSVWGPTRIGERQEHTESTKAVTATLGIIPWLYLIFAVLYAVTRSRFIICQFDPFIGIFRLGGDVGLLFVRGLVADFICFHREAVLSFLMSLRSVIKSFLFGVYLENSSFPKSMYQLRTLP